MIFENKIKTFSAVYFSKHACCFPNDDTNLAVFCLFQLYKPNRRGVCL